MRPSEPDEPTAPATAPAAAPAAVTVVGIGAM
ncbi:hypothetical protein STVIR_1230 [Streptomyces viridochromogenes Tue57]|uniref:Uncharacterized protein n=1 Tax=Streptomyces viridochromogenes Tue57 TaxID=1160705 RepID=L8PJT4_STRVR|nr:hypothetical protein STVIR_1230 [Streptomyces viridochromogenes Tue57]